MITVLAARNVKADIKALMRLLDKSKLDLAENDEITDPVAKSQLIDKTKNLIKSITKFRTIEMGSVDNQYRLKPWFKLLPDVNMPINEEMIYKFFKHMFERQEIWYKRNVLKKPGPWTKDHILRDYKFTNTYRELDRASQYLIRHVLSDPKNENTIEDILFKIFIFRFYNQPDAFSHNKYAIELQNWKNFDAQKMWEQTIKYRAKVGNCWHVSYMTNMAFLPMPKNWEKDHPNEGLFKDHAYVRHVFPKVHAIIPELKDMMRKTKNVKEVLNFIEQKIPGVATFLSHEFFLDFCYVKKYWRQSVWKFTEQSYTNVGPGASLGVRLLFPSLQTIKEQEQAMYWLYDIAEEQFSNIGEFKYIKWNKAKKEYDVVPNEFEGNFTVHNIEFALCEFSKRWKMEIGEGKQRSKFIADSNDWKL